MVNEIPIFNYFFTGLPLGVLKTRRAGSMKAQRRG